MNEIIEVEAKELVGDFRPKVLAFEKAMESLPCVFKGDSENCPLTHKFAPGVYVREIFIPAGMLVVGKIHKHDHPNFLMSGEVLVVTEDGGREHLKAPLSMISKAGTKRIVFALQDTVWITVHATNEQDLEKIEEDVIAPSYESYEAFKLEQSNKNLIQGDN
jgi:hypothetical protein